MLFLQFVYCCLQAHYGGKQLKRQFDEDGVWGERITDIWGASLVDLPTGENLLVEGLGADQMCVGDEYQIRGPAGASRMHDTCTGHEG